MSEETIKCNEDKVNHPSHYEGKYECIDEMIKDLGEDVVKNFCLGNVYKYLWRATRKNGMEDIRKSLWYLDKWAQLEWRNEPVSINEITDVRGVPIDLLIETQGYAVMVKYLSIEAFICMKNKLYKSALELLIKCEEIIVSEGF